MPLPGHIFISISVVGDATQCHWKFYPKPRIPSNITLGELFHLFKLQVYTDELCNM